ncbi:Stk1 family PASTA domain-containing Ser/Thr kinase [Nocardioides limicola]|uniref:Stk1 family PASTA domain-containing Ser/Thr kinase n=1 Tax=Nocardioides limicola TaxID=2803368 RepID=UPI00193B28FF|nr:Stk1 family PASTA domain-containing Ser/Thr kinase [Nocardioides sp. DJM-14]
MTLRADSRAGADDPVIGRLLDGRYRATSRIARGGMATVYAGIDERLDRTVALKVMHPGLGDDDGEFAARFVREARAAARLSHPHVVNVFDQGDDNGTIYLAMELVEGRTFRDVVHAEAPMPPTRALALLEPVLSALAAAHRAGVVHRDVKPENVLIADDGRVKVADFGLARAVSTDTRHTATGGVLIGTVSYLAPELVVDGTSDARADVYAAGVLLYELLTGTKPHQGESPIQVAYKHVHCDVPAPSEVAPDLPDYVDALVARATCRDRHQRPADAAVLLHQMHRVRQALDSGADSDPELAADLRPRQIAVVPEDTQPEDFEGLVAPSDAVSSTSTSDHTTLLPTATPATSRRSAAPDRPSDRPSGRTAGRPPTPARAAAAPSRPRRSRRGLVLLLIALLVASTAGLGAWWLGVGRYSTVPAVIGVDQATATERLEALGLTAALGEPAYSETVPPGDVIASDPAGGQRVLSGGTVTLMLSLGPERYLVPEMAGRPAERAATRLENNNLVLGQVTERHHEEIPAGTIIRSDPEAGTELRPDSPVDIVVSLGRRPYDVRDFTGRPASNAVERLGQRFRVVTSEAHHDSVPEGRVISQTPSDGTLFRGDEIRLVVSLGPELVTIPRGLRGMGVAEATAQLEALGLVVDTAQSQIYLGLGYVAEARPGSGTQVRKGSTVTLYLV